MRKNIYHTFLFVLVAFTTKAFAQNLVPNGSFEKILICPWDYTVPGRSIKTKNWYSPSKGTPDLFAACGEPKVSTPRNYVGFAYPKEGANYIGLFSGRPDQTDDNCYREYLTCSLKSNLEAGKDYTLTFYARPASYSKYIIDKLTFAITSEQIKSSKDMVIRDVEYQIVKADTLNMEREWYKLTYNFVAKGGEGYLTIGDFFLPDSLSRTRYQTRKIMGGWATYYLYDDFSLTETNKRKDIDFKIEEPFIIESVHFEFDSYHLSKVAGEGLNDLFKYLSQNENLDLFVYGHTDNVGSDGYNEQLSIKRAETVKRTLVEFGIDAGRIKAFGYGKKRLISKIDSLNRRTEFKLVSRTK